MVQNNRKKGDGIHKNGKQGYIICSQHAPFLTKWVQSMKKTLSIICAMLTALAGCRTSSEKVAAAPSVPVGRPEWFNGEPVGGCPGADEYVAFWRSAFEGAEQITAKMLLEAQSILDEALLTRPSGPELAALEHNHNMNDYFVAYLQAREAFAEDIRSVPEMDRALSLGRRLLAMRDDGGAAGWMARQVEWERGNGDPAGAEWSGLFQGRKPLCRLPEVWMSRAGGEDDNLAAETLEAWRAAGPEAFRLGAEDGAGRGGSGEAGIWIMQVIEKPEVPEGARIYMNLHAFPGRCVVYANGAEAARIPGAGLHTFSFPIDFDSNNQCRVAAMLPGGYGRDAAAGHSGWPAWLSVDASGK